MFWVGFTLCSLPGREKSPSGSQIHCFWASASSPVLGGASPPTQTDLTPSVLSSGSATLPGAPSRLWKGLCAAVFLLSPSSSTSSAICCCCWPCTLCLFALSPLERKMAAHRGCPKSSAALTASGCLGNFKQGSWGRQQTWCHRGQHTRLCSAGLAALAKRPGKYLGLKDQGNLFRFN